MAYPNVEYLYGTMAAYQLALQNGAIDDFTYYKITDDSNKVHLFFGHQELTNAHQIEDTLVKVGDLSALKTTDKSSLVGAINEILTSSGGSSVDLANEATPGIVKLYTEVGENIDGAMTQKAVKEAIEEAVADFAKINKNVTSETLVINI